MKYQVFWKDLNIVSCVLGRMHNVSWVGECLCHQHFNSYHTRLICRAFWVRSRRLALDPEIEIIFFLSV
jgi:hypothetical protein